ncbi:MAG: formylmethanofuran dehydrogenase subunit B [Candidatus Hodarchaeota archaeon]
MVDVYTDVVCTFCGCLCDDIEIHVEGGKIVKAVNSCAISRAKFLGHEGNGHRKVKVSGSEASVDDAIKKAAEILVNAENPMIYGLASTSNEAIRKSMELAEMVGAKIDNTSSVCHAPTLLAMQFVGDPKCTLGHVRNLADVLIFWGCNPTQAHPRHFERYSANAAGFFTPKGKEDKKVVFIDVRETRSTKKADLFIKVEPDRDVELAIALKALLKGKKLSKDTVAGVKVADLEKLVEMCKNARFVVTFFGLGLTQSRGKYLNIQGAISLAREFNKHTKFHIIPLRGHYNVTGANSVMTWISGFGYAVDYSRGYPRYSPGEFSAVDALSDYADAALIIASDPVSNFPKKAVKRMAEMPLILMDPHPNCTFLVSDVYIPVLTVGIETEGTAYRMDGVPLYTRKVVDGPAGVLSDEEVLDRIMEEVKKLQG